MNSQNKYFLSGLASYVIWGFLPILFKQIQEHNGIEIIFYRLFFAAILMNSILLAYNFGNTRKKVVKIYVDSKKDFFKMAFLTTFGAAMLVTNWVCYVYTVNHISIKSAAFGYMILPIVTAILALVILKEKITGIKWLGIGLSVISCYLISSVNMQEIKYIFAIAGSYSLYLISQRNNTYLPRNISLGMQMTIGTILMLFLNPLKNAAGTLDAHFFIYIFIISAVFTVAALLLNLYALTGMKTSQLSYLIYVNPIISFVAGIFLYHEEVNDLALVSYVLLAISVIIFNWDLVKNSRLHKIFHRSMAPRI